MAVPDLDELLRADGAREVNYPSDKFEAWLASRGLDGGAAYLAGCVFPKRSTSAYPYYFPTETKVIAMNGPRSGTPRPLDDGLLVIATALAGGDLLAVDLRDGAGVGIIDHERVWDDVPVRDVFAPFAESVEELARLMHRVQAPGDYAEARAARRRRRPRKPTGG